MTTFWKNADGLTIRMTGVVDAADGVATTVADGGLVKSVILDINGVDVGTAVPANLTNGAFIPAGSLIKSAVLYVETAFTSGGAATLTLGTYDADGDAVDADGIDAAVALAAINAADKSVVCDGAQVATTVAEDCYVAAIYGVAAYTAGKARLVIEYMKH